MDLQQQIDAYLAKGGKIEQCPKGKKTLPEENYRHLLRRGLWLLWQVISVIGTGNERPVARKRKKGIKYKLGVKRGSKWG